MISSNDFRPGVTIELDGEVWRVVEFLHVKPGKGSAFVRTTLKSAMTGKTLEKTFRAGETLPQAVLEKSSMQHTYKEGDDYIFMDMQSFDEATLTTAQIGARVKYIKEGMEVNVVRWGEKIIEVELPNTVVLEVIETDPGLKGDTATGGSKTAKVETGASIMVPLFVNIGDRVKIDTREDTYLGRENQVEFSLEQLRELVTILNKTDITELTLESGDLRLSIRKSENRVVTNVIQAQPNVVSTPAVTAIDNTASNTITHTATIADSLPTKKLIDITSPMVGTFYRSPGPDESPFVEIGDSVKKGSTVCIIEAMKLMNEIESESTGKIVEILVENTQPVEYGQVLMRVEAN